MVDGISLFIHKCVPFYLSTVPNSRVIPDSDTCAVHTEPKATGSHVSHLLDCAGGRLSGSTFVVEVLAKRRVELGTSGPYAQHVLRSVSWVAGNGDKLEGTGHWPYRTQSKHVCRICVIIDAEGRGGLGDEGGDLQ